MSISEAVRIWKLDKMGLVSNVKLSEPKVQAAIWCQVLAVRNGKALLKRGRKTTWADNRELRNRATTDSISFVTMPAHVAASLVE